MPAGDGTGPEGMGPGTGRGMGYCAGYDAPGWMNPAWYVRNRSWYGQDPAWYGQVRGPGWGYPGPQGQFYGRGGRGTRGGRRFGLGPGRGGGWGWR